MTSRPEVSIASARKACERQCDRHYPGLKKVAYGANDQRPAVYRACACSNTSTIPALRPSPPLPAIVQVWTYTRQTAIPVPFQGNPQGGR